MIIFKYCLKVLMYDDDNDHQLHHDNDEHDNHHLDNPDNGKSPSSSAGNTTKSTEFLPALAKADLDSEPRKVKIDFDYRDED